MYPRDPSTTVSSSSRPYLLYPYSSKIYARVRLTHTQPMMTIWPTQWEPTDVWYMYLFFLTSQACDIMTYGGCLHFIATHPNLANVCTFKMHNKRKWMPEPEWKMSACSNRNRNRNRKKPSLSFTIKPKMFGWRDTARAMMNGGKWLPIMHRAHIRGTLTPGRQSQTKIKI